MTLTAFLRDNAQTLTLPIQTDHKNSVKSRHNEVPDNGPIFPGKRNATLSPYAFSMLKQYGNQDGQAYAAFMGMASRCQPPLEEQELNAIWNSALKGYAEKVKSDPSYISPERYNAFDLRPEEFTDVDESVVLYRMYGNILRYSKATGWIHYNGLVWQESEAQAHGCMHYLTSKQLNEINAQIDALDQRAEEAESKISSFQTEHPDLMPVEELKRRPGRPKQKTDEVLTGTVSNAPTGSIPDDVLSANMVINSIDSLRKILEAERSFYLKNRSSRTIGGVLKEAQTALELQVSDLDKNGFSLNTPDGEVDLRTGKIEPNQPESFHTHITKCGPSEQGSKLWSDFLKVITCGDADLEAYLQLIAGEIIIGKTLDENLIIAYGTGRNGKSTFFNTLYRVMGDYGFQIRAELLTTSSRNGKAWEIGELRGKRLVLAPELEEGTRLNASFVKQLCSTDQIMGEKKNKDPFIFEPSHTVVLFTNFLPKVGSSDRGTWSRLIVIPFNAVIQPDTDVKNYADYLTEKAGGAVLAWMIEGAKHYIASGFKISKPQCVADAVEAYRASNDWLSIFLDECVEKEGGSTIRSSDLYERYRRFSEANGDFVRSNAELRAAMENNGFTYKRGSQGVNVIGLKLKTEPGMVLPL